MMNGQTVVITLTPNRHKYIARRWIAAGCLVLALEWTIRDVAGTSWYVVIGGLHWWLWIESAICYGRHREQRWWLGEMDSAKRTLAQGQVISDET